MRVQSLDEAIYIGQGTNALDKEIDLTILRQTLRE